VKDDQNFLKSKSYNLNTYPYENSTKTLPLKLKISHNKASNVYLELVILEGMGHEYTHP